MAAGKRERFSDSDLQLMDLMLIPDLIGKGVTNEVAEAIRTAAVIIEAGQALPPNHARFIAARLRAVADDPWSTPFVKRTAAQAQTADIHWQIFNQTMDVVLNVAKAPRGQKTRTLEEAAAKLGIDTRSLRRRIAAFGLTQKQ